jgi:uncharacterized membrane protein YkoI
MTRNRSMSAALALALALALTACEGGGDDAPAPTPEETAATTQDEVTATATQSPTETATESPSETGTEAAEETDDAGEAAGEDADESEGTVEAPATGEATEADDDTDDDGQDDDSDGVVGGGPAADLTPSALAAIETALGQADGTAYEVDDREDGFWEVDVMTVDGALEVTVAPDGTTVDGTAEDADDALDDAGRQALAGAQVSLAEAIVAAVQASEGQLDSAELAPVDGAWWWRVVVDSPSDQDIELRVDPATGEVVASEG